MSDVYEKIQLYRNLFDCFLILTLISLGAALVLFFVYDIRSVFAYLTGRKAKKTIREMEESLAEEGKIKKQRIKGKSRWVMGLLFSLILCGWSKAPFFVLAEAKQPCPEKPQIQVDEELSCFDKAANIYWKSGEPLEISVTAESQTSKLVKIEVSGLENSFEFQPGDRQAAGTLVIEEEGEYTITVTDQDGLENAKTITVKQDVEAPENEAFIRFFTDTEGANDPEQGTMTGSEWSSGLRNMEDKAWNKIWGRKRIAFEVYVYDEASGVAEVEMKSHDMPIAAERVEGAQPLKNGGKALDEEGREYTVFRGVISSEVPLEVLDFQIVSMTDLAGNSTAEPVIFGGAENTGILYLDAEPPKLSVMLCDSYGENQTADIFEKDRYFYRKPQKLILTMEEDFFGRENRPVYPKITMSNEQKADGWEQVSEAVWQREIELPLKRGEETEIQMTMSYTDPSGNALEGQGVENGIFESRIFVLDDLFPKLLKYEVNSPANCSFGNIPVCKNDPSEKDLRGSFAVDDHEKSVNSGQAKPDVWIFPVEGSEEGVRLEVFQKEESIGRIHTYDFAYDGDLKTENEYYVKVGYADAAGNRMVSADEGELKVDEQGYYTSPHFIIDHSAPKFQISYSDAENVVKTDGTNAGGKKPFKECTAYYRKDIEVSMDFEETYANRLEDGALEHFEIQITRDGEKVTGKELPKISWTHQGNRHRACFCIPADEAEHTTDGNYQFCITYRDCAENPMEGSEVFHGAYKSPVLVLDTTAPEVFTKYVKDNKDVEPQRTVYGRDYFQEKNIEFQICVKDRNIRCGELKTVLEGMKACDAAGEKINDSVLEQAVAELDPDKRISVNGNISEFEPWSFHLPLATEANYEIPVDFTDLAGNAAKVNGAKGTFTEKVTVDGTVPELELSYFPEDPANYVKWGYLFAKDRMKIKVTAKDRTAGIRLLRVTITDEDGKATVKEKTFSPGAYTEYLVELPTESKNFKGNVLTEIIDYAENKSEKLRGHIVESEEKHDETGRIVISSLTKPSRIVRGKAFYNTDVKLKLIMEDSYSGLAFWKYIVGNTLWDSSRYKEDAGQDLDTEPEKELTDRYETELILSAEANNQNDVFVKAAYTDNAGHSRESEQKYNIDITKPEILVSYDLNEPSNGRYYQKTRTATVKIRERNFDPSDVEFLITGTDGSLPVISGWESTGAGDEAVHTCSLAFAQDGDYTFTVKFQDMAGNLADYSRVDEFTIDKTAPVVRVSYDNHRFLNESYYNDVRTATIDILEHNFDPDAVNVMITAEGDAVTAPGISFWKSNGDHHIATVTFREDGEYTFDIEGLDLALNRTKDYAPDHFIVDRTAPEIEIFNIGHLSANKGAVRPGIRYRDTNFDPEGAGVIMTGYHNGGVKITGTRKENPKGLELRLDDFAYEHKLDDLYTMKASACDLAGNSCEKTVVFSVNRFGSVYTFDRATEALVGDRGKYYTNKGQELLITETNVDALEFKEITMNLNGKLTTLKEGTDYSVRLSGNDDTWKQYTYRIFGENFQEEGTYLLTIYSEDRAKNPSDNNSKGKKIEFVVDRTNPSLLISGAEDNGQYRENSRRITLDLEDNVRLLEAHLWIDGVETVLDEKKIREADGKPVIEIESANHWQEIRVVAADAAGNETEEKLRVLVTANMFVQYISNPSLIYGSLGILALTAVLAAGFLRRKKSEEKRNQSS